jgi:hypothetical protein
MAGCWEFTPSILQALIFALQKHRSTCLPGPFRMADDTSEGNGNLHGTPPAASP